MTTLTVRNLDDRLKHLLRLRAAENGRSMEAEVRQILSDVLTGTRSEEPPGNWAVELHRLAEGIGGIDMVVPPRDGERGRIPDFWQEAE